MLNVIHTNIRKTAMPRTGRALDALVAGASGAGGSSVAAQGEQYWEIVTVGPDGAQLAQEDYYLRPRQELNVVSQRNLIASGDVIAKSADEEIEDAELPIAGYGASHFGLTAIKQGGGLLIDSNNLVYVDPNFAGGGGLDLDQLEEYLTGNNYLKKNDPVSSLLMTGYAKYSTNSAISATDNAMVAIGKLERKFDYYVTLDTTQTIAGSKTFAQDIIGQKDIIAKSTSTEISDAELPIASTTQLGLIKAGSGVSIASDGTLSVTGGGGLSEVYWDDIKGTPTTLAGYGITDALSKTGTAASASKLSPGCNIWGQAFTGESDVTGNLTLNNDHSIRVYNSNSEAIGLLKLDAYNNLLLGDGSARSQYDTFINGRRIIFRDYVDNTWHNNVAIVNGNTGFGTTSPQAKVHVVGDGLFTGDVISKSTSTAISDAELPIASTTQLGLIKAGYGVSIAVDGTLSVTGGGGLTEVFWTDIKKTPTTLEGYGITDAYSKTESDSRYMLFTGTNGHPVADKTYQYIGYGYMADGWWANGPMISFGANLSYFKQIQGYAGDNSLKLRTYYNGVFSEWREFAFTDSKVASASKLSPGCKIWGQAFTGESDISGNLTLNNSRSICVYDRTSSSKNILTLDSSNNLVLGNDSAKSQYDTYINGRRIIFRDYIDNSWSINAAIVNGNFGINTTSASERLHVVGNALIAGRLRTEQSSTSYTHAFTTINKAITGTDRDYKWVIYHGITGLDRGLSFWSYDLDNTVFNQVFTIQAHPSNKIIVRGMADVRGDGLFTGDVICKSTSTAISDAELPIASANTFGLIKVGSGLKITNGVLSATGGSGGGSNVYWGTATDDKVPLYVDDTYYELSRNNHSHDVATSGSGNAVTGISFDGRKMILSKGSTFSLNGHTHSQYLTGLSYTTTGSGNVVTNVTASGSTIKVTFGNVSGGGSGDWSGGTITTAISKGDGDFLKGTGGAGYRLYLDYSDAEYYVDSGKHFQWFSGSVKAMQVGNGYNYAETNWQEGSDMRKKNVLGNISNVLDDMVRVDIFRYTWKHIKDSKTYIGLGAQLIEDIFPDVVSYNKEYDTYGVDYSAVGCIAFQGVKELYTLQKQTTNEIDVLKQRIALLEAENQNLWNIINEMKEAA